MPSVKGRDQEPRGTQNPGPSGLRYHLRGLPKQSPVWAELQGMRRAGVGKNKERTFQKGEMACAKKGSETGTCWA